MQAQIQTLTTTDQQSLCVKTWGDSQKTPLVLVHGYPDNQEVWEAMIAELVAWRWLGWVLTFRL